MPCFFDSQCIYVYGVLPLKDVTFGVSLKTMPIYAVKCPTPKNLHCGRVNRNFQAKLADCEWMAVCHLQVDPFLPITGEMFSAGGGIGYKVRYTLPVITGRERDTITRAGFTGCHNGQCIPNTRAHVPCIHGPCIWAVLKGVLGIF